MKTIQEAANICGIQMCDKYGMTIDMSIPCEDSFEAGVKFAEEWIPIERVESGIMTTRQADEIRSNRPFLIKSENGIIELLEYLDRLYIEDSSYTNWRPIKRK